MSSESLVAKWPCEECGEVFDSVQKRGAHKRYKHGAGFRKAGPRKAGVAQAPRPGGRASPAAAQPGDPAADPVLDLMRELLDFSLALLGHLKARHEAVKPLRLEYIKLRKEFTALSADAERQAKEEAA